MPAAFFASPPRNDPPPAGRILCDKIRNRELSDDDRAQAARRLARLHNIASVEALIRQVWLRGAPPPHVFNACADGIAELRREIETLRLEAALRLPDAPEAA